MLSSRIPTVDPVQLDKLIEAAIQAKSYAYAPYSNFRVGAALLCNDGSIIAGCNVENASYGGSLCAERTAIVKAVSQGKLEHGFAAIAVTSDNGYAVAPCGICRQTLREFCPLAMPVVLVPGDYPRAPAPGSGRTDVYEQGEGTDEDGVVVDTVEGLLPRSFGPEDLGKSSVDADGLRR